MENITGNEPAFVEVGKGSASVKWSTGLTIRQHFASNTKVNLMQDHFSNYAEVASFLGITTDDYSPSNRIELHVKAEAKIKAMTADALIAELNKNY